MDRFIRDLQTGEIHQRDRFQFELKSEFFPTFEHSYTQEFYLFIPNSLQINEETYPPNQFYRDQTNLIRYKTPEFSLKDLARAGNERSPLEKLNKFLKTPPDQKFILDELKLLGNALRSSLRERTKILINIKPSDDGSKEALENLAEELETFRKAYFSIQDRFLTKGSTDLKTPFLYVDEFISNTITYYLTGLIGHFHQAESAEIPSKLLSLFIKEEAHRINDLNVPQLDKENRITNEYVFYRNRLLNKYVIDALQLKSIRTSIDTRFRNLIGSLSAGIAMLFFFVLFVWQREWFYLNSLPFILFTVLLYIIKDRIKESMRLVSYRQFSKWFFDYNTDIRSPVDNATLGKLSESVSYVFENKLPMEIEHIRNREFHTVIEDFQRPEQVIYYKRIISIFQRKREDNRRHALNIIFRFNIAEFIKKADDPLHSYLSLNLNTMKIFRVQVPKVYHLNLIMRTSYRLLDNSMKVELKKFRLIVDKEGIKRIEHVYN